MKTRFVVIAAVTLLALQTLIGVGRAQEKAEEKTDPKTVEIVGEVIDLGCWTSRGAHGEEHQTCAVRCIKGGNPAGILNEAGKVYTIAAPAPKYSPFAGQTIRVSGVVKGMAVRPEKMEVRDGKNWKEIEVKYGAPK